MLSEAEWRVSEDPRAMLDILKGNPCASERKLRLFALNCANLVLNRFPNRHDHRFLTEVVEQLADGIAQPDDVRQCRESVFGLEMSEDWDEVRIAGVAEGTLTGDAYFGACSVVSYLLPDHRNQLPLMNTDEITKFLRCIFGTPYRGLSVGFRLYKLNPAWLTSDVVALARGIYDNRAFDRLPILADALQDAGCDNADVLSHCRDTHTPHARGCWVVDLVLGKA